MTASTWDNIDLNLDGGDFITLRNVGDKVSGVLKAVGMHDFNDGKGPKPQLTLTQPDGTDLIYTAGPFQIRQLLAESKPEIGDRVSIELIRLEPRTEGKAKIHTLAVDKGVGAPAGAAPAGDEPPF